MKKPTPTITQDDAAKIRKAQVANILKRLASGRTITAAQQALLDAETVQPKKSATKAPPPFTWPIWESKKQAAEVLGWPPALLTQIQKAGCPGFRHNRVYFGEVVTWLGTRGLDDADIDWSRELKKQQAIAAKRTNQERDRVLANVEEINEANQRALAVLFGALDRIFCSELPPALKDLDPLAIKGRCEKEITRLKQELHEKFTRLANEKRQSKDSDEEVNG